MEDTKIYSLEELKGTTLDFNYTDLRQTQGWSNFLNTLGWKTQITSSGIFVQIINTVFMKVAKIQRPHPLNESDMSEIDLIAKKYNLAFVKIEPSIMQEVGLLVKNGYQKSLFPLIPPSTVFMDLTLSENDLWSRLSHSAKYSINRARREGTVVKIIKNPTKEQVEVFQKLAASTGLKKKFYVPTLTENLKKATEFLDNCVLAFSYDSLGELTGAKFHLINGKAVWYLHGGTSDHGQKDKSGYLLTWETILYFKQLGMKIFDFEGVSDPRFPLYTMNWEGLTHFKRKFNGYEAQYPDPYIKIYNPVLKSMSGLLNLPL